MSFTATFQTDSEINAKLNPSEEIKADFESFVKGSSVEVEPLSVTANGTYTAPTGKAYSPISVAVPSLDISDTTAVAGDVRSGKKFHLANGSLATGSYAWNFMGDSAELVSTIASLNKTLANSGYATWTPAGTAYKLEESTTNTASLDLANYEYWVHNEFWSWMTYSSDATGARAIAVIDERLWNVARRVSSPDELVAGTGFTGGNVLAIPSVAVLVYYNSSNVLKTYGTATYGVYMNTTINSPTLSSTSSATPTLTVTTPTVNVRCNATYFSTTNAGKVNQSASGYRYVQKLYRTPIGGLTHQINEMMSYRYNHLT